VFKTAAKPKKAKDGMITNPVIKIENIVVSADLHAEIDLYLLSKKVKEVDYEPEQFPGAIFKIAEPRVSIILFKNGKMICTGASTEANIKKALDYAAKVISRYVIGPSPVKAITQKS
jgi:transcription initiation factor TFIID TATA-box-binding protein